MSFGGSHTGGRTRLGTKVILNVYDLAPANAYLYPVGLGLHHSGVEILGTEYSFASGAGIFESSPKEAAGAVFREQIEMGNFDGGQYELRKIIAELRDEFGAGDYNLIRKNCNHFANALCWRLLRKTIPSHINRLADLGVCCNCLLPRKLLENAPVGDPNNQGFSGFTVKPANRGSNSSNGTSSAQAFHGSGVRLGAAVHEEQIGLISKLRPSSPGQDDLTDRREKARKAAMARLDRNRNEGSS